MLYIGPLLLSLLCLVNAAPNPQVTRVPGDGGAGGPSLGSPTVFFPSLLVPIKQDQPNTAFGTQYTVDVSYTPGPTSQNHRIDTLVSFFINLPQSSIRRCSMRFVLPPALKSPSGFPWSVSGSRAFEIVPLSGRDIDAGTTTYNNCPVYGSQIGTAFMRDPNGGEGEVDFPNINCKTGKNEFALRKLAQGAVRINWFELRDPIAGLVLMVNP